MQSLRWLAKILVGTCVVLTTLRGEDVTSQQVNGIVSAVAGAPLDSKAAQQIAEQLKLVSQPKEIFSRVVNAWIDGSHDYQFSAGFVESLERLGVQISGADKDLLSALSAFSEFRYLDQNPNDAVSPDQTVRLAERCILFLERRHLTDPLPRPVIDELGAAPMRSDRIRVYNQIFKKYKALFETDIQIRVIVFCLAHQSRFKAGWEQVEKLLPVKYPISSSLIEADRHFTTAGECWREHRAEFRKVLNEAKPVSYENAPTFFEGFENSD